MAKIKKTPPKPASDEAQWKKRAHNDTPTGEGNTLGEITGQPPKSTDAPKEANPILNSNTQYEKNFANQVYDSAKKAVIEGGKSAGEMGKGAVKDTWNFGIDIIELGYPAAQLEAARDMEQMAMWSSVFGNKEQAKLLSEAAEEAREMAVTSNLDELRTTLDNPEQETGALLTDLNPKGVIKAGMKGIAKGGSKVMSMIFGKEKGSSRKNSRARRRENKAAERDKKTPPKDPEELKKELKEKQQNKGGKVKGVKKTKVPCFDPYDSDRYKSFKTPEERKAFLDEYADQLRGQQAAINDMSPEIFQAARKEYDDDAAKAKEEKGKNGGGRHDKAEGAQRRARRTGQERECSLLA